MMKTVYMTDEMLNESILLDKLPEDVLSVAIGGKTSLGNNPALPEVLDDSFVEKCITGRFSEARDRLMKIGRIDDVDETEIHTVLSRLMDRCQEMERPIRGQLEKICLNHVIGLFAIPTDMVTLNLELVDDIDYSKYTLSVDPYPTDDDEFEFDSIDQITDMKSEVYKRRLLNCISMGAGLSMGGDISSYIGEIYRLDPKLADIYNKVLALNDYLLFTKEDAGIDDKNKMQAGTVSVSLGGFDELVTISAQAKIFPILLSETIRGMFELFTSHGLPEKRELARRVVGRSDFIKAEPWDMRIGPYLWGRLYDRMGNCDTRVLPYAMANISRLGTDRFNEFFREVFSGTKFGRKLCWSLVSHSTREYENSKDELMTKSDVNKSVIADEYSM